jgi:hypothetical protein
MLLTSEKRVGIFHWTPGADRQKTKFFTPPPLLLTSEQSVGIFKWAPGGADYTKPSFFPSSDAADVREESWDL